MTFPQVMSADQIYESIRNDDTRDSWPLKYQLLHLAQTNVLQEKKIQELDKTLTWLINLVGLREDDYVVGADE